MTMTPHIHYAASRTQAVALAVVLTVLVGGCASPPNRAPVEDRGARPVAPASTVPAPAAEPVKTLPGVENAGKPGFFTVRPGDTLIRVGLESGQNWRDIARWNNIDNPNLLEVGQVLRVTAPGADVAATSARAVPATKVEVRPLDGSAASPVVAGAPAASAPAVPVAPPASAAAPVVRDEEVVWAWPVASNVSTPFDESRSKGLTFTGKAGDPVLAAGDGRVIYVGSGVRGYGNLVIVKHNNTYLTAYAHNQTLLVKEDQVVRRGQKIAEMGSSDAERVQLHFEIRKLGKPVDPARLLPPR
jgi:lipoprotein NlpD